MRDSLSIRKAVEKARRQQEQMAADRVLGEGRLGDVELTGLLETAYPTLHGQHNCPRSCAGDDRDRPRRAAIAAPR